MCQNGFKDDQYMQVTFNSTSYFLKGLYLGGYDKSVWAFIGKLSAGEMPSASAGKLFVFLIKIMVS